MVNKQFIATLSNNSTIQYNKKLIEIVHVCLKSQVQLSDVNVSPKTFEVKVCPGMILRCEILRLSKRFPITLSL